MCMVTGQLLLQPKRSYLANSVQCRICKKKVVGSRRRTLSFALADETHDRERGVEGGCANRNFSQRPQTSNSLFYKVSTFENGIEML